MLADLSMCGTFIHGSERIQAGRICGWASIIRKTVECINRASVISRILAIIGNEDN